MLPKPALASLAAILAATNAAPSLSPRAGTIGSDCNNLKLVEGWLVGDCLTGNGAARITSGTYLNNKIENDQGSLAWKEFVLAPFERGEDIKLDWTDLSQLQ